MLRWKGVLAPVSMLALAACGGGGAGSDAGGTPPVVVTPAPAPTPTPPALSVVTSAGAQTVSIGDDDRSTTIGFDAVVSGGDGEPYFANVQYDGGQVALQQELKRDADNRYQVRFRPAANLPLGRYDGTMVFRLCRDPACATVLPGTEKTFSYAMTLRVSDWSTFQRNAAHSGHVGVTMDPAGFRKLWEVTPSDTRQISEVASRDGLIYTTTRNTDGTFSVRALDGGTGQQRWLYSLGQLNSASPPAVGNGKVLVTTMTSSSVSNPVLAIDAADGRYLPSSFVFASQWADFLAPTPYGSGIYLAAGYTGNVVYGHDTVSGATWSGSPSAGGIWDGETPAVDASSVYYYGGGSLGVFDRLSGALTVSLSDPFYQSNFYDYYGAPLLGSLDDVMVYSGNRGENTPSVLLNWTVKDAKLAWRSGDAYSTTPAVGGGIVYLARNTPARLDALDEGSGAVRWSWSAPAGETFLGNTVVTDNLVFVSTDKAVYALPIAGSTHQPVWSATGDGGQMAITADGILVIAKRADPSAVMTTLAAYRVF